MKNLTWLRIAFIALTTSTPAAGDPTVKIEKSKVTYRGVTKGSVEEFYSIKFAHDTSSARRFAPPEPYTPPEGSEIEATSHGPACPQPKHAFPPWISETPDQSEDCLHLRISRPAGTTSNDKLPVAVHIVGGGVVKASASDPNFDPTNLITHSISLQKPIIHVVFNYRLNIYGFARLGILKDRKSLNVGMRDQRAGYQWVKDNIAAFGGDPDKITSFGLSSGGTFSSLHLMTFGGEQGVPFNQVWAMSGPPGTALNITSDATEIHTHAVAEQLGCEHDGDEEKILECLREVPVDKLTETATAYSVNNHPPGGLFTFIPSIDGDFLPDRQSVLYKAGKFVKGIPMVFGWTQDDGSTNAGPAPTFQTEEDMKTPIKNFAHALTDDDYEKLFALYPASDFKEEFQNYQARKKDSDPEAPVHFFRVARIMRDILFTCSSIDFGYEMWRQSKALNPDFPGVRHYDFNQSMATPLFHAAGMPYVGAVHGSDLDYIYNNIFPRDKMPDQDKELSDAMITSFLNFVYTGDASGGNSELWPESFTGQTEPTSPSGINLHLIGGPLGTGPSELLANEVDNTSNGTANLGVHEDGAQNPLVDSTQFGEMGSPFIQARKQELQRERLFERCAFINSLAEKLGH
ncbi:alpha/beta-hydrolase [Hypoxylon trugodes]|uniref:alpha/beta-hydrolase n=1 Tax=Hypoxylon trugodes TaxID=326681 RepID=UPI00219AB48C|nr:alpha/beta-hydrolase [Hypoxylon trugodes]KAI1394302.1 alpha/beta-hydrolase [Hypoxylon trugodes]